MTVETNGENGQVYTRERLQQELSLIASRVMENHAAYMHAMLAMNHILRLPNAPELLQGDLRDQAKDIWLKLKSTGLQLADPPVLFGE